MSNGASPITGYDDAVLWVLAYEFGFSDKSETEKKIRQKLRDRKLGPYQEARIASLRAFKDAIQEEIHRSQKSKYYTHSHDRFADIEDFDRSRMTKDYAEQFRSVSGSTIERFVDFAVYLYYLR